MTLAVALAAWGTNVKAEGWLDTRVMKTKEALAELLGSLDPVTYGKAMEVLQWDLWLLTDGRLDPTDEPTIIDHMGKLAKLFPEETGKVLKAMNEVETIVAANQVAALNESLEEKRIRRQKEEITKHANWILRNPLAVTYNTSDTATATLKKIISDTRVFSVETKEKDPEPGAKIKATANFIIKGLAPGTLVTYSLSASKHITEDAKEIKSVRLVFINKDGKTIDMAWQENPGFSLTVEAGTTQNFTMPINSIWLTEKIDFVLEPNPEKDYSYTETEFRAWPSTISLN